MNAPANGPPNDMGGPTDDDLWSLARRGDPAAFGELFTRHAKAVYNYCFQLTGSWSIAEDLTSVVFIEAWRRRHRLLTGDGTALAWLLVVASGVARHSERSVRRHRHLLAKLPPAVIEANATEDYEARTLAEHQRKQVLRIFRRLSWHEQEVLALCVWGQRTHVEAAVALGVAVGTVRSRLERANEHVKRLTESSGTAILPSPPGSGTTPEGVHQQ